MEIKRGGEGLAAHLALEEIDDADDELMMSMVTGRVVSR